VAIFDADGNEVPSAVAAREGDRLTVRFLAALPSVGYALFRVLPAESPYRNASLRAGTDFLENERLLVRVNENGDVSSIFDKKNGVELLRAPLRLEILSNSFRGYGSWEIGYDDLTAPPRGIVSGPCRREIAEQNGCRVALRVERVFGTSRFTQLLSLDAGGDRLDVRNDVNWTESCSLLKAAFELDLESDAVRYDAGLGSVERGDRTPLKYEVPVGKWASLYDRDKDYSVTILNDCKHGMDKAKNVLRLTLIHTPANRFMDETRQDLQDFGQNLFSFAILGGRGDFRAVGAERAGTLYHVPPVACLTGSHEGILPPSYSFFSTDGENVAVRALKMAEDGDEIVVRLAESAGEEMRASFTFGPGIVSAREINGYEEPVGAAEIEAGRVPFTLSPFEPKSFAVRFSPPAAAAKKPVYTPLPLEGSFVFSSRNASRGLWGLDEDRTTFPRELLEKEFRAAGIPFSLAEKDGEFLCLIPEGGELSLPRETGVLHLIAARRDEDGRCTLLADGRPISFGVECFRDDIGGWDQVGSGHFGFIREDRVALSASHTHDRSGDRVYGRFSWYLYSLRLPEGTEKIVFPRDPGLMIAAVTAERGGEKARLVTDIALHKKEKKPRLLTSEGSFGGGLHRPGEPVRLIFGGRAGEVVWKASDGSEYRGVSVAFDMPDRDLKVRASVKPYAKKLPAPVRALADTMAEEGHGAERLTDGRRDTLWRSAVDGAAEILLDLGARRRFSHLVLFHAGAVEKDQTLNTFDYAVDVLADGAWKPLAKAAGNILPVTAHDFPEIRAEFLRVRFLTPTHNGNDRRAALAAAECYADADYGEETEKDSVTAYDLA
ncbi:MAG: discoidin domain-containing protein, partial [Clostridia bacterium]|nr:discoidin domain-containing protein [Clostridia bacterium]